MQGPDEGVAAGGRTQALIAEPVLYRGEGSRSAVSPRHWRSHASLCAKRLLPGHEPWQISALVSNAEHLSALGLRNHAVTLITPEHLLLSRKLDHETW